MAVALFKLGLSGTETVLEIGCGTGKVSVAMENVQKVFICSQAAGGRRDCTENAEKAGMKNIEFFCIGCTEFLTGYVYDCAFVGGTKQPAGRIFRCSQKR